MARIQQLIPLVKVDSVERAVEFYCDKLGFEKHWVGRTDPDRADPGYATIRRDGWWLHISSHGGDGVTGAVVNLAVDDVDSYFEEFRARGVEIQLEPYDQSWGTREMYLNDPDGNKLRFGNWLSL